MVKGATNVNSKLIAYNEPGLGVRAALQTARFQHDTFWRHDAKPMLPEVRLIKTKLEMKRETIFSKII